MGKTSNISKQRWNANHYAQIKVSVTPEIAEAFKAKCKSDGVSMASKLSLFMCSDSNMKPPKKPSALDVGTRQKRRKALTSIIQQVESILDAESRYMENIPDNLLGSIRHDAAEQAVSALEEALENLYEAYP